MSEPAPTLTAPKPQPGLIKTIGILNILLGALLLLFGLACLNVLGSSLLDRQPLLLDPIMAQAFGDELRRAHIESLRKAEVKETQAVERERIKNERLAIEAKHTRIESEIDLPKFNVELDWLVRYFAFDALSALVLNLFMIVSGLGLLFLKNQARLLAMTTAALKIARLIGLVVFVSVVVTPRLGAMLDTLLATDMGGHLIAQTARQYGQQGADEPAQQIGPADIARLFRGTFLCATIFFTCLGLIYPSIVLILFALPNARAATSSKEIPVDAIAATPGLGAS